MSSCDFYKMTKIMTSLQPISNNQEYYCTGSTREEIYSFTKLLSPPLLHLTASLLHLIMYTVLGGPRTVILQQSSVHTPKFSPYKHLSFFLSESLPILLLSTEFLEA